MKTTFILLLLFAAIPVRPQRPNEIAFRGNDRIYVIRADGTGQTAITGPASGTDRPRWSRDGRQIVFTKGNFVDFSSTIWKMNADGSNQRPLSIIGGYGYVPWQPVFSPNADRIAYAGCDCVFTEDAILIAKSDGSSEVWVTGVVSYRYGLDWSPTGERLLYSEFVYWQNPQFYRINSIHTNGTSNLELTTAAQGGNFDPVWSPDGSKIAFVSLRDGNSEIYTMNSDGSNQVRVTNSTAGDGNPTWSPDGKRLAFSSNRNGPYNIYVMNADGTNLVQITHNEFDSVVPHWNPSAQAPLDFDGDGRSDISVFRPSDSVWYLNRSSEGFFAMQFGIATDTTAPADYDGDGKTDIAVYRDGTWWITKSSTDTVETRSFGLSGDIPVPADYTGDGRDELAVYRNGQWWALDLSNDQASLIDFGLPDDKPVPADYDGDGIADAAVFRPSDGSWWIRGSAVGWFTWYFGVATDKPVPGDYTGDGKTDIAVWRPSNGNWYVLRSEDQSYYSVPWGLADDMPTPGDYDGDGRWDISIWRPSNGVWYLNRSTAGTWITPFGVYGDRPIPNTLVP